MSNATWSKYRKSKGLIYGVSFLNTCTEKYSEGLRKGPRFMVNSSNRPPLITIKAPYRIANTGNRRHVLALLFSEYSCSPMIDNQCHVTLNGEYQNQKDTHWRGAMVNLVHLQFEDDYNYDCYPFLSRIMTPQNFTIQHGIYNILGPITGRHHLEVG